MRGKFVLTGFALVSAGAIGCGWMNTRSDFERDPFVMSHLTHEKRDPMYATTDSDVHLDDETPKVRSASTSRKTPYSSEPRRLGLREGASTEAGIEPIGAKEGLSDDYGRLSGALERRKGNRGGWFIRYGSGSDTDRYGGELLIVNPDRLGLAREGDRVELEGQVVTRRPGEFGYRIRSVSFLDDR